MLNCQIPGAICDKCRLETGNIFITWGHGLKFHSFFTTLIFALTLNIQPAHAQENVLPQTYYEWWLVEWHSGQSLCQIFITHAGLPSNAEVNQFCGQDLYQQWADPFYCEKIAAQNTESGLTEADEEIDCQGLYLFFNTTRQVEVDLAPLQTTCARIWDSAPPEYGLPDWLQTPPNPGELASNTPYAYLAGRLIVWGMVDASACDGQGLNSDGMANACGLEKAGGAVEFWQNRFDENILTIAQQSEVPAQLLKNIIAQESQFWPGVITEKHEYGMIQMTDQGADTALLWNRPIYDAFCRAMLSQDTCNTGYAQLSQQNQALLRGAFASHASAECPQCEYGVNLLQAEFSIHMLAQTLVANCTQVEQIIYNHTFMASNQASDYENLWRFTLANYNAGPGCLSEAIAMAWMPGELLTWESVSAALSEGCQGAIQYVDNITRP